MVITLQKQTVGDIYNAQKMMREETEMTLQDEKQAIQNLSDLFKKMEQGIVQAHQSVRQAQFADPTNMSLQQAEQRLQLVIEQIQQLKSTSPAFTLGLPKATQQQLMQLDHLLTQAGHTMQLIKNSVGSS